MFKPEIWKLIPEEKRKKILQASMEEFEKNGYDKASTNEIIKKAEISKGLLFHYFGSKKNLYLSVLDISIEKFVDKLFSNLKNLSPDFIQRLLDISKQKLNLFYENPLEYHILMSAFMNIPADLKEDLDLRYNHLYQNNSVIFFQNIDYSLFRTDIDPNKAIELIMLSMEGISNRHVKKYKGREDKILAELPNIMKEIEEYLHILKVGLYKQN